MPTPVAITIEVNEDLTGISNTKSALDQLNASAASGFKQTKSALDDMSSSGITGFENLRQKAIQLQSTVVQQRQQATDKLMQLEEMAGASRLDKNQQALTRIMIQEQKQVEEYKKMRDQGLIDEQQFQDARVAIDQIAEQRRQQVIQRYGTELESLYDRTIGKAKSASDALKNIWSELANWWKKQIFDQIAAWILGQPTGVGSAGSAAGAVAGPAGLGGFLGSVLGAGGLGGGVGSGVATPPFISNALPGAGNGPLGISGGGAGAASAASVGAGNIAVAAGLPATTPIGTVMAKFPGLFGLSGQSILMGGLGLETLSLSSHNQIIKSLSGIAGGALIGSQIGSIIPGIGTAIGAGIGALIGGIASLFGGDPNKKHDADIANQGFARLHQILDDYYHFRTTYQSAIASADNIWSQMSSQWVRKQSAISQKPYFDQIITAMQQTEDERIRRQQLQGLLAVPEFASGGLVGGKGGMVAIVHPGEFVMTRQAVDRIGTSVLQGLNEGTGNRGQGTGGLQISLDPDSGAWLEQTLAANPKALQKGIGVILRSGGPVSRALRA